MKQDNLVSLSRWRRLGSDAAAGEDNVVFELLERVCRRRVWFVAGATGPVAVGGRG